MRLNSAIKQAILAAALKKAGIFDREAAIRQRYADWAENLRRRFITPEVETLINDAIKASRAVPEYVVDRRFRPEKRNGVELNNAGQRRGIYWNGEQAYDRRDPEQPDRVCPSYVTLPAGDPDGVLLDQIDYDAQTLKQEREQLTVSVMAVLNSVNTDKKLIEVWPEAVAFIPAAEKAAAPQLPALPIASLNKMIGLP